METGRDMEGSPRLNVVSRPTNVVSKVESDNLDLKKCFNILNSSEASKQLMLQNSSNASLDSKTNGGVNKEENDNITLQEELSKRCANYQRANYDGAIVTYDDRQTKTANQEEVTNEKNTNANTKEGDSDKKDSTDDKKEQTGLQSKLNFNGALELRKSLTEQLCEEISMKLGRVYLCKSFLETYIYEKNPYLMNFVYAKDTLGAAKNKVLNALLASSFSHLVWKENIYTHEYLLSKDILRKYAKTLEMIPDKSDYAIVPVFSLDRIKEILDQLEASVKLLKRKKMIVKKNNENLLFIMNIIKNNLQEIKSKGLRIVQRLLFRLNLLDKLLTLKNGSTFVSSKYEQSKLKLITLLDFFNSFNIDSKLQKINESILELTKERVKLEMDVWCNMQYADYLNKNLTEDETKLKQMKATASEISTNLEENKECLYYLGDMLSME